MIRRPALFLLLSTLVLVACAGDDGERRPEPPRTTMVAAGDIASCWWRGDEATARLLDRTPGVIAALGDLVYQDGTPQQFARCYGPTWGRHIDRTRPTPGNHDYRYQKGAGYYDYFGARAGERRKGWYSYALEGWHVVVLNSEEKIDAGSEQLRWLEADLRAHPARCTLVYTHRPRFSSGKHGGSERMEDAFRVMYADGVDVLLGGHDHHYERFAPQDPDGGRDDARGVRQFVIGTGGSPTYRLGETLPNSEVRDARTHGVLRLMLHADGYEWEFVPVQTGRFTDRGRGTCTPAPVG